MGLVPLVGVGTEHTYSNTTYGLIIEPRLFRLEIYGILDEVF